MILAPPGLGLHTCSVSKMASEPKPQIPNKIQGLGVVMWVLALAMPTPSDWNLLVHQVRPVGLQSKNA